MGASPDDLQDFYTSDLGPCRSLAAVAANGVSTGGAADVNGPLSPGRYLVQTTAPGGTDIVFIGAVPYKKGDTSWNTLAAAAPRHPLSLGRGWIEVVVRKGHNDRIFARTTGAATATVFITQISRVARQLPPV